MQLFSHTQAHTHTWAHKHTQSLKVSVLSLSLACSLPNVHSFPLPIAQRLFHFVALSLSLSLPLPLSLTLSVARCLCCSVVAREIVKSSKSGVFTRSFLCEGWHSCSVCQTVRLSELSNYSKRKPLNLIKPRLGNVFVFQKFPSTGRRRINI